MFGTSDREDWKVKYRELLDELENKEREWRSLDESLRGVASRLAIAAMGRDARVDRHLGAILDAIRGKAPESELIGELDDLSDAVLQHEKRMSSDEALDLSSFVASLNLHPAAQKRCIDGLESQAAGNRVQALRELAGELNTLLEPSGSDGGTADPAAAVARVLEALVRHMDSVPGIEAAVNELRKKLHAGIQDDAGEALLKRLADSVSDVIHSIDEQRSELESFLEQVTRQLAHFEEWTRGNDEDIRARRDDTDELEEHVGREFDGLHSDLDTSSEMADLKERVQARLDAVAEQLRVFREKEERRVAEANERNDALRDEINRLKVRTAELAERVGDQENRLMHDTLTGAHTRYAYDQRIQEEFQRWQRHGQQLAYSIWDIDLFKQVNDNYGHQTGDRLLAAVASILTDQTRVEDFVARMGGEEFVVLFPATSLEQAAPLAERLRENVASAGFHYNGKPIEVTISCGLTAFRQGDTPRSVYERADQLLYRAKDEGRNRCVTD